MSKTDLVENEVKDAEAKEEVEVVEKKLSTPGIENSTADKRRQFVKQHNVIIVRKTANFKTLVVQTKNLLKNQFESVELHGTAGDGSRDVRRERGRRRLALPLLRVYPHADAVSRGAEVVLACR